MDVDEFLRLGQYAIETAIMISLPMLGLGLVAGLVVSIFQAAKQTNDSALAFIPKIGAAIVGLVIFGHFMVNRLASFTTTTYDLIGNILP